TADGVHDLSSLIINHASGAGANAITVARATNDRATEATVTPTSHITFAAPGAVLVRATGTNVSGTFLPGGTGGGLTVTVLVSWATVSGHTKATVEGDFDGAVTTATIQAIGDNTASVEVVTGFLSIIGINAVSATAEITPTAVIEAYVSPNVSIAPTRPVLLAAHTPNAAH